MKTYEVSDNTERRTIEAESSNAAVEPSYENYAGSALEVYAEGGEDPILHVLIDQDGTDHSSWHPALRGPIESEWMPVWQTQGD